MSDDRSWTRHLRGALANMVAYDVPPADGSFARMHANECPVPWPPEVLAELGKVVAEVELNRYPDTSGRQLRAVLGQQLGVDPDRVVLGNGSDEIIAILLTALTESTTPSGVLVIPSPTFVMYGHMAQVLSMEVREVPLTADLDLDLAAYEAALEGATVTFLARPNNPTSSLWDADTIWGLIHRHPGVVFVIDEAYAAYAPRASMYRPDGPSNYVHMATLSKVGLAALRLGYCVADPELAVALNKVRHPYNVSATTLALAEAALTRFPEVQADMVRASIAGRERLRTILGSLPGAHLFPAHGNLVLVRLDPPKRATEVATALRERGVLVKDVSRQPALKGCLRVSVGTPDELDRLERALAEI